MNETRNEGKNLHKINRVEEESLYSRQNTNSYLKKHTSSSGIVVRGFCVRLKNLPAEDASVHHHKEKKRKSLEEPTATAAAAELQLSFSFTTA
jgi:hypothetical protein